MKAYSQELARAVYDVLVNICGAREDDRENFVYHATNGELPEWRFQGHLGFGGKYRGESFRVNCYREDETPERLVIIERANAELAMLNPALVGIHESAFAGATDEEAQAILASSSVKVFMRPPEEVDNDEDGYTYQ